MTNVLPLQRPARRAVLYLRQSEFREESMSLESQEHITRTYAEQHGYTVVAVERDGITGKVWTKRPGVVRAMAALEAGDADVIVLWRWSRLSRNRRDWAVASDRADIAGGRIESATEPTDVATAAGRFQRGVMVEMAVFESERIGEQWREVHDHRVRHGLPATGGPRFGYLRDDGGGYVPDPETAPVLADLYRRYLGGMGAAQLTRHVNTLGVYWGDGKPWTYQGLMRMLDSGFAAGLLGRTKPKVLPVWERQYRPGAHEPIITRDVWDAYVARRAQRYRVPTREAHTYLLTGLVRCSCGSPMHGKKYNGRPTYVCSRSTVTNDHRKVSMVAWRVDELATRWVLTLATDVDAEAEARARHRVKRSRAAVTARSAQRLLKQAEARLATLTVKLADGKISDAAYALAVETIEQDRAAAQMRMRLAPANPVEAHAAATLPRDLERFWAGMTNQQKAAILRPLIERIEISPARARGARDDDRVRIVPTWPTG